MKAWILGAAVAASLVACSSSNDSHNAASDAGSSDASADIDSLISAVCQRDFVCEGSPAGYSAQSCAVTFEDTLVGSPADCPLEQEIVCLKDAAALPCGDAGGTDGSAAVAVAACVPCFPPMLGPDASASHPVDAEF